ncbi:hypothetical protein PLAN_160120 [Planktothrix rubescens CCAP 1459/22]|uniref:Uncharacterized protein n=1 Tax=Planktothrix rubescens CCAP 1459/22 TaxID=329571 RepID=A0A6J7ZJ89_PLARU|nr:hypothetical protein PLAN_160120 [Planktothrix rubescens NIVA-CYA 18]
MIRFPLLKQYSHFLDNLKMLPFQMVYNIDESYSAYSVSL